MVDVITGLPVRASVTVEAEGLRLVRNRRGDYIIFGAARLEAHIHAFVEPPATPTLEAKEFRLQVTDLSGRYLPRRSTLRLPRNPDPAAANSIFAPAPVALYSAPAATTEISWGVLRATVREQDSRARLPWALVRVLHATTGTVLATGLADARGEALIAVPGILITMPADDSGPVVTTELEIKLTVAFDGIALRKITDADLAAGNAGFNAGYVPNPDDLSALTGKAAQLQIGSTPPADTGKLASGRILVADVLASLV
jgi:hypothetical protein